MLVVKYCNSQNGLVGIVIILQAGKYQVRFLDCSLFQYVKTMSVTHPASCSVGTGALSPAR